MLPATAVRAGDKVYVGAFGQYKWGGKFYDREVLGLSREYVAVYCTLVY